MSVSVCYVSFASAAITRDCSEITYLSSANLGGDVTLGKLTQLG